MADWGADVYVVHLPCTSLFVFMVTMFVCHAWLVGRWDSTTHRKNAFKSQVLIIAHLRSIRVEGPGGDVFRDTITYTRVKTTSVLSRTQAIVHLRLHVDCIDLWLAEISAGKHIVNLPRFMSTTGAKNQSCSTSRTHCVFPFCSSCCKLRMCSWFGFLT